MNIIIGVIVGAVVLAVGSFLHAQIQELRRDMEEMEEGLNDELSDLREDLNNTEKHVAHAISENKILKGGMEENDQMLDTLFEREKFMVDEINTIKTAVKTRKPVKITKMLKKRRLATAKDMTFHLTNNKKQQRRSKQ